ncbi:MAG: M28 family peptidase [Salinivirgaceae bacterium]|nr:M28 family peptidase [Salinivirgaceae bacterium]
MKNNTLIKQTKEHLHILCTEISERRVGSKGNRKATNYLKSELQKNKWKVEETLLKVMDWKTQGATLSCGQQFFDVFSSPYSLGCSVQGELVPVDTIEKLYKSEITDKIVFLYGKIASEQIMPKNFEFYNPEEHKQIIASIEQKNPKAIICATSRNSALAGGVYPFPLFEDGDFDIPSVYMKDVEGEKLLTCSKPIIKLESKAKRIPETAYNIVARKEGKAQKRIVISAHIDSKIGTQGAIDNATGVTVLLLLSELFNTYNGKYQIELVAFNGEDYYAVSGQMKYIKQNKGRFNDVVLNINIDGVGYIDGLSCISAFNLPDDIQAKLNDIIQNNPNIVIGLPWYQGDHSIFIQNGCPALAISSDWLIRNMESQEVTHTTKDNLSIINFERIPECVIAIKDLINALEEM